MKNEMFTCQFLYDLYFFVLHYRMSNKNEVLVSISKNFNISISIMVLGAQLNISVNYVLKVINVLKKGIDFPRISSRHLNIFMERSGFQFFLNDICNCIITFNQRKASQRF